MKNVLLIEDDAVVAHVYRNKLVVDGYSAEVAGDGETGLRVMRTFKPQLILLDLMLPGMSGLHVIKEIRAEAEFSRTPMIVFTNTYMTNLIQEAWRAGATKCVSKSSCTPKQLLEIVRNVIGDSGAMVPQAPPSAQKGLTPAPAKPAIESDTDFHDDLHKAFLENLPGTLQALRAVLQTLVQADNEGTRLKHLYEMYRQVHALNGLAGLAGLPQMAHVACALEALLKELYVKPKNINASSIRTLAATVDFLGFLIESGAQQDKNKTLAAKILAVDDDAISRRAIVYALEKARLECVSVADPVEAMKLLTDNEFDLVFLDVDMPGLNGFDLCARLRALPQHKDTPVVFVTGLNDFESRVNSVKAGGTDFIGKPFLFIELTVKALILAMRRHLQVRK